MFCFLHDLLCFVNLVCFVAVFKSESKQLELELDAKPPGGPGGPTHAPPPHTPFEKTLISILAPKFEYMAPKFTYMVTKFKYVEPKLKCVAPNFKYLPTNSNT